MEVSSTSMNVAMVTTSATTQGLCPLVGLHALDLRLAEVGGHPQPAGLRDGEELLPRLHAVADIDRALADDAFHRRGDARVAEVQLGLLQLRLGQLQIRLPHREARF